jgi:hypothetical protein
MFFARIIQIFYGKAPDAVPRRSLFRNFRLIDAMNPYPCGGLITTE